ncbi:helix-turn-helix domain-containing protein [Thetidibacter halocola]|uniref:Helix-turn-helix transcriptional regulator n=1 Tax=Thetidibacter halocola TaxID=2827239 RepID=A0A8J7WGG0_9RHOB|nr:helix-turn-helix transcriptional regulator [Thetidibacter halocola]MBS0124648.1 helix-turn-helix transcriptional regulator [Thetidibacter halocola]
MSQNIDKTARAALFRTRLVEAMAKAGSNRTALARAAGVDRSTLSQLLRDEGARLPGAHLVAACAAALGVSTDWLLGLSDRPERAQDLVANALSMTEANRAMADRQIVDWHREAEGYRIRHVPATLPDMLKTRAVLDWEYGPHLGRSSAQAIDLAEQRLDWMRGSRSQYEMAMPVFELESFARGEGYWRGLPPEVRGAQIDRLIDLTGDFYPRLRVYLFDARRLYSAPVTVFGPLLAAVYLGRNYLVFRDSVRIDAIAAHFDQLVKEASVSARALPAHLETLRALI